MAIATDNWLEKACNDFPNVLYSHVTFTIPSELRALLLRKPDVRKILFEVSSQIVLSWCKERGFLPAITSVLHTFGRDLKFHPHIHMLVSAGGLDIETKTKWINCFYLPDGMLKKRWQTLLLYRLYGNKLISHRLKRTLFRLRWYLYVAKELLIASVTTNYIGRYTKIPPLAEARILGYDSQKVTFYFEDWYLDKAPRQLTVSVDDFIALLIQHISPKHFRLIRHYGLLHNPVKKKYLPLLQYLFGQIKSFIKKTAWRLRQKLHRHDDPLLCPICGKEMKLVEIAFWSKKYQHLWVKPIN